MLTKLTIRNFKGLKDVEIELGQHVVFVGPNNSGKTTALQALALWSVGVYKQGGFTFPVTLPFQLGAGQTAVSINRLELTSIPVPFAGMLWRNLRVQDGKSARIEVLVNGINKMAQSWVYGLGFEFVNEESLNAHPIYSSDDSALEEGANTPIVFLPAMSGLASSEDRLERGSIETRIGQGRTAEVLRNLCYLLYERNGSAGHWDKVVRHIREQFGVELLPPEYLPGRGEIRMFYKDRGGITLDLSASGRGMLQVLLLLAYLYNNPGAVVLLDEPDAHLEIIRQREVYNLLTSVAAEQGSQIIAATHSEVILEEAADRGIAVAFVGKPHRIDRRNRSQVTKALNQIRAVDYHLAEQTGWVLYLEGSTDLAILQAFARRLNHPVSDALERAFVHYIETNKPSKAVDHFQGLREAKPDLAGVALFDRIPSGRLQAKAPVKQLVWAKREIENYLIQPETLAAYALEGDGDSAGREQSMQETVRLLVPPIALGNPADRWWADVKASEEFLDRVFELYLDKLELPPDLMRKTNYHVLANFVPAEQIDPEVIEKLDAILDVAQQAKPRED